MQIPIPYEVAQYVLEHGWERTALLRSHYGGVTVDHMVLTEEEIGLLTTASEKFQDQDTENAAEVKSLARALARVEKLVRGRRVSDMQLVHDMVRLELLQLPNRTIFVDHYGHPTPLLVTHLSYHRASGTGDSYTPACVRMTASAVSRGELEQSKQYLERSHFRAGGVTGLEVLAQVGWEPESEELWEQYYKHLEFHRTLDNRYGIQLSAYGPAGSSRSWGKRGHVGSADGTPAKVILDDDEERTSRQDRRLSNTQIVTYDRQYSVAVGDYAEEDGVGDPTETALPITPVCRFFDTTTNGYYITHVGNLERYIYTPEVADKLVLPHDTKAVIDLLVLGQKQNQDDVVAGKGRGSVVLMSGPPGTGKTLTAEVYSERVQTPLYSVQCSQLGTTAEGLEEELSSALERADKWGGDFANRRGRRIHLRAGRQYRPERRRGGISPLA